MEKVKLNDFLKDLSYFTEYKILEAGKNDKELADVAKRHGIKVPAKDIAIFKGIYAFTDRQNLNGCTLPKEEVAKSLDTIGGKAVDFDHFRKRMVGHWLEGHLEGDKIISYGVFNKGNFPEDYKKVSELMDEGKLKISFEAWGTRTFNEDGKTYDFSDIEFSGGALLIDTTPAFPGADVLELAKVMTAPDSFVKDNKASEFSRMYTHDMDHISRMMYESKCPGCGTQGAANINAIDFKNNQVHSSCGSCGVEHTANLTPYTNLINDTPVSNDQLYARKIEDIELDELPEVENADEIIEILENEDASKMIQCSKCNSSFSAKLVKTKGSSLMCPKCDAPVEDTALNQDYAKKLSTDTRNNLSDDKFAIVKTVKNKVTGKPRKIRMFPIHDANHVRNALSRIAQGPVKDHLKKLGISPAEVEKKIKKKAKSFNVAFEVKETSPNGDIKTTEVVNMEEIKKLQEEVATLKTKLATLETENATVKSSLAEANSKLTESTAKLEKAEAEKTEAVKVAKEQATKIAERKAELGPEFAKDIKDEDLLDDVKFENAKLKKEVASLKATKKPEKAAVKEEGKEVVEVKLEVGSKLDMEEGKEIFKRAKVVSDAAWGK